jgi:hypothetical protein
MGWDSNPRNGSPRSAVFKTAAFNRSATHPASNANTNTNSQHNQPRTASEPAASGRLRLAGQLYQTAQYIPRRNQPRGYRHLAHQRQLVVGAQAYQTALRR